MIDFILVPQGTEYQAVCRGIGRAPTPLIVPIPVGSAPLSRYLDALQQQQQFGAGQTLLVMGLCGGLAPEQAIGDLVLYRECIQGTELHRRLPCDPVLTERLQAIAPEATLVTALTSYRLVWSAPEKHQLAHQYGADVVDMEGFAVLASLQHTGATIAMLRVISDNAQHNLPRLTHAIDEDGTLRPLPLAWGMLQEPIAAIRLIRGSLKGLKTLQQVATVLCQPASIAP